MRIIQYMAAPCVLVMACFLFSAAGHGAQQPPINEKDPKALTRILLDAEKEMAMRPDDLELYKCAGVALHQLALFSGKGYAEKGIRYLDRVVKAEPDNAVMLAYYGSLHTLHGRDGTVAMQRLSNVNKGVSLLNRAVKKAPDDVVVRMVRASVFFELPPMFKQTEAAFEDFLYIESRFADIAWLDADLKAEVYYKLGFLADEKGYPELRQNYFSKAVEAAPGSKWAELAQKG